MKYALAILLLLGSGGCGHLASTAPTTPAAGDAEARFRELVAELESRVEQTGDEHAAAIKAADRAEAAAKLAEAAVAAETPEARSPSRQAPPKTIREPDASHPPGWERVADDPSASAKQSSADSAAETRSRAFVGYDFLYFTAEWCAACRQQQPVLQQLHRLGYRIGLVDVDRDPEVVAAFAVTAIPAYVAAVDGQTVLHADGRPKISHGSSATADPRRQRVDVQAVLDLLPPQSRRPTRLPPSSDAGRSTLKERAARHDWAAAPAYVDFPGNMNPQDYIEHLVRDHGFTTQQLSGWSGFELFQLHSAVHCPRCSVGLTASAPMAGTPHQYAEVR